MSCTVSLIPALCGKLTDSSVTLALLQASQADIEAWEKKHIPYTVRKKRHAFFNGSDSQNAGNSKAA
jgi:ribosomal protein S6